MERNEIAAVLAYLGRLDPRTIRTHPGETRDQLAQWHELLHDIPFTTGQGWDVRETVRAQVLASPYPPLPVDIARAWRAHRRDRLDRHTDPTPAADPDDTAAWQAELARTRRAVAAGEAAPASHRQLTSGGPHRDVAARLSSVGYRIPAEARAALAPYRPARTAREVAVREGLPDALGVPCPWCRARAGEACRSRRVSPDGRARGNARRATPHPTRRDLAVARGEREAA
ncbi:hypothetical protein ABZV64_21810 [Streptomyces sp. NPDC004959]|uniref:zinc finger domain-containing protein n=1 Tax=Streptomyces sp. NPDC004959 TaxID=3154673 RepID=UPI0033A7B62A